MRGHVDDEVTQGRFIRLGAHDLPGKPHHADERRHGLERVADKIDDPGVGELRIQGVELRSQRRVLREVSTPGRGAGQHVTTDAVGVEAHDASPVRPRQLLIEIDVRARLVQEAGRQADRQSGPDMQAQVFVFLRLRQGHFMHDVGVAPARLDPFE